MEWAGVPRAVAKRLVGYKTDSVYNRYAIVSKQDLSDGLARVAGFRSGEKQASKEATISCPSHDNHETKCMIYGFWACRIYYEDTYRK